MKLKDFATQTYTLLFAYRNELHNIQQNIYVGTDTEKGVKMAIEYLESIKCKTLTASETYNACYLAAYKGKKTKYSDVLALISNSKTEDTGFFIG